MTWNRLKNSALAVVPRFLGSEPSSLYGSRSNWKKFNCEIGQIASFSNVIIKSSCCNSKDFMVQLFQFDLEPSKELSSGSDVLLTVVGLSLPPPPPTTTTGRPYCTLYSKKQVNATFFHSLVLMLSTVLYFSYPIF